MENPFLELCQRYSGVLLLWLLIAGFPPVVATLISLLKRPDHKRLLSTIESTALVYGYFAAFLIFIMLPWITLDIFVLPILFDIYPAIHQYARVLPSIDFIKLWWPVAFVLIWPCWVIWLLFKKIWQPSGS